MVNSFPICPHFKNGACCCEIKLSQDPPLVWKEVLDYFPADITPIFYQNFPLHWRVRAKMAVRGTAKAPLIGLFKRHSHEVAPLPDCLAHHPRLNQAFALIQRFLIEHELVPYQEESGKGDLRYLQGVVERKTGRVQMTFILNAYPQEEKVQCWQNLLKQLGEQYPAFWHSLWINFNNKKTNTIWGAEWQQIYGLEELWETFDQTRVCYHPSSFGQANLDLFERLLKRLREWVPSQARVAEFYAGVGVIGLFIAAECTWVRCTEISKEAENCFERSCQQLEPSLGKRLSFLTATTQQALSLLEGATVVIVDPPRKGLENAFMQALETNRTAKQLIYVSCGWESFKRDCQQLQLKGWFVKQVEGYFFFPGTNHLELLVNFERKVN